MSLGLSTTVPWLAQTAAALAMEPLPPRRSFYRSLYQCRSDKSLQVPLSGNPGFRVHRHDRRRFALVLKQSLRGGGDIDNVEQNQPLSRVNTTAPLPTSDIKSATTPTSAIHRTSTTGIGNRGMTLTLAACYFTVMGAKCALPATLSLLTAPRPLGLTYALGTAATAAWTPQQYMARQLTLSTLAIAMGKLVLGPVIDWCGGKVALQMALLGLAALLGTIANCQSFATFAVAYMGVDFIFSSCWAACLSTVREYFGPTEWPSQIASLAAAARAGNSVAFLLFAGILQVVKSSHMVQYWRPVFAVAALVQLIPLVLLQIHGRRRETQPNLSDTDHSLVSHRPSMSAALAILRREAQTLDFWLHLTSRSALMLFASFLLFVPTLMTQVYQTSASFGAQVGSWYALGCLVSVTTLSQRFAQLRRRDKLRAVTLFLGLGATGSSLAQLAHMSGVIALSPVASALLLFVWGFSFAIPFYIPPSLYALARGGRESSATIADVFDIGGFGLLALFNGYVAGIDHAVPAAWITTFAITTGCSLVSFLALFAAVWRESDEIAQ
jgi:MFS family permease